MIETIINSCLHQQCLLAVTTHHPLTNTQSFIGMLTPKNNSKDKIRIHLYDEARRVFLYDDTGEKIYVTIKKIHIKTLTPIQNIIYSSNTSYMHLTHKTRLYKAYYRLRKPAIKVITKPENHHLSRVFIHENILAINQASRMIPVLSYQLRLDINTNTYEKTLYIHHEQALYLFFHALPNTGPIDQLVMRFKAFIKSHITVNESPFTFLMRPRFKAIKPSMIMRPMHHPYKALNHVLTPKNLGRKTYILPPFKWAKSATLYQTVTSSLTHPVTLSYLPHTLYDITKVYQQSGLLNQKNTLIIAPPNTIKSLSKSSLVLPLMNHAVLDDAIDNFLRLSDVIPAPIRVPMIDYHDFFTAMETHQNKADYMVVLNYLKHVFEANAMSEYSIRLDALINQQEQDFSCDVSFLYTLEQYKEHYETMLNYHQAKQRAKLSLPLYKEIFDVFMLKDTEKRRQEVLKWLHKPKMLNRLKNIFPVIVTHDHAAIYPHQNTFDMLVTYNHKTLAYHQLGLSSKITMIVANPPHLEFANTAAIFAHQYTIYDQFYLSDNTIIKQYNMPNPLLNRPPLIHDIKAINYAKHTVYNHLEYIEKIHSKTIEPLAIRTPFHAQKAVLQRSLSTQDVHTIYIPTIKRLILSLPIHPNMPQKTYDWIKNHAFINKTLHHAPLDIIIDLNAMYHLTRHEDTLAKTIDFYHKTDQKTHHITVDKAIDILISACLEASDITVKKHVKVSDLFTDYTMPNLKTIPYLLQNHTHTIACIELPFQLTKSQYQLLVKISRYNRVTLITYYKPHKTYIDRLMKILESIDLIKAR